MALQLGFDLIRESFTQTSVFGVNWIITLIATAIVIAFIAGKDFGSYPVLLLPVTTGLHIIGLTPSMLQYIIAALMFVMTTISLEMLGSIAETATAITTRTIESTGVLFDKQFELGKSRKDYRARKEKLDEMHKEGITERLGRMFKRTDIIGTDKEGKPIKKESVDIEAIQQARELGLGATINKDIALGKRFEAHELMLKRIEAQEKAAKRQIGFLPGIGKAVGLDTRSKRQKSIDKLKEKKFNQEILKRQFGELHSMRGAMLPSRRRTLLQDIDSGVEKTKRKLRNIDIEEAKIFLEELKNKPGLIPLIKERKKSRKGWSKLTRKLKRY